MKSHNVHHFVPAAYYRPWCGSDKKLVYFTWSGHRFRYDRASPKSITKQPHLYSLHGAPAEMESIVETGLFTSLVDDPGATIHQALLSDKTKSLSLGDRYQWVRYLLALRARTPEVVGKLRELGAATVRDALRQNPEEYEAIKPEGAPATLEECISPWYLDNFGVVRVLPKLVDNEKVRDAIVAMHWSCYDFSDCNLDILTCDRPLIWHGSVQDSNFFLAMPLSPRIGFFIAKDSKTIDKLSAIPLRELAIKFNESVVANAVQYVYASNDKAKSFVGKRLRQIGQGRSGPAR